MRRAVHTEDFISSPVGKGLFKVVRPLIDRLLGFHQMNVKYSEVTDGRDLNTETFCAEALKALGIEYHLSPELPRVLSQQSPLIILANHPYGGIDSFSLMHMLSVHFPQHWKIVCNKILEHTREIYPNLLFVNPFAKGAEKRANVNALREMNKILKEGGALLMFPAARVSGWDDELAAVKDLPWTGHPINLAQKTGAQILFLHLSGGNSQEFLAIPPENLLKRTLRLAKEILLQQDLEIKISYSDLMTPEESQRISRFSNKEEILRAHGYLGADRTPPKPAPGPVDVAPTEERKADTSFHEHLTDSQRTLLSHSGFSAFCFRGEEEPTVLEEIGRLREETFKQIGAGSGRVIDLSDEDLYYHHIVVTEEESGKIAGSYRVGFTEKIISERGVDDLYLDHVFNFKQGFYDYVGNSLELSRSFITVEFQKHPRILDMLWRAVGKVATENNCKGFYGSVTISDDFTPLSQAILVTTLDQYYSADKSLRENVSSDNPFHPQTTYHKMVAEAYAPHGVGALAPLITDLEGGIRTTPPLIKYYTSLNAQFLSFKVEPTFKNAIYCLLYVEIEKTPPRFKKRLFGIE